MRERDRMGFKREDPSPWRECSHQHQIGAAIGSYIQDNAILKAACLTLEKTLF